MNRSEDPFNPGNHVIESLLFYPRAAQWVAAPENHVAGPISFSFDFFLERWDLVAGAAGGAATVFQFVLVGTNELPPHDVAYVGNGAAVNPRAAINNSTLDGDVLAIFNWGDWWDWADTTATAGNDNGWLSISSDDTTHWNFDPTNVPGVQDGKQDVLTTELTQTYPYYAVAVFARVYHETHPYFWLYGAQLVDTPAIMFDNVSLQVSVTPTGLPGDFNGDGVVNTEDINPFILALTDPTGFAAAFPDVDPLAADPNGDSLINTEDINPFIALLTGGGEATIIPEPASLALLGMGAMALMRRRR
jgi:hypothetical protein